MHPALLDHLLISSTSADERKYELIPLTCNDHRFNSDKLLHLGLWHKVFPNFKFQYLCLSSIWKFQLYYLLHSFTQFMWSPFIPTPFIRVSVMSGGSGFLLRILCCSQSGNHPENNWAKFGYILHLKVDPKKTKSRILLYYSCLRTETYHKNLAFFSKNNWNLPNLSLFSMKNPMYRMKSYFSSRNLAKIRQWKNH
jgi:hypothetical protein